MFRIRHVFPIYQKSLRRNLLNKEIVFYPQKCYPVSQISLIPTNALCLNDGKSHVFPIDTLVQRCSALSDLHVRNYASSMGDKNGPPHTKIITKSTNTPSPRFLTFGKRRDPERESIWKKLRNRFKSRRKPAVENKLEKAPGKAVTAKVEDKNRNVCGVACSGVSYGKVKLKTPKKYAAKTSGSTAKHSKPLKSKQDSKEETKVSSIQCKTEEIKAEPFKGKDTTSQVLDKCKETQNKISSAKTEQKISGSGIKDSESRETKLSNLQCKSEDIKAETFQITNSEAQEKCKELQRKLSSAEKDDRGIKDSESRETKVSNLQCKSEDIKEETFQYMNTTSEAQRKCKELQKKLTSAKKDNRGIKDSERLKSNQGSKDSEEFKVSNIKCKTEDIKDEPFQYMNTTLEAQQKCREELQQKMSTAKTSGSGVKDSEPLKSNQDLKGSAETNLSNLQCKSEDIKDEPFQYMSTTLEAQQQCKELQQKISSAKKDDIKDSESRETKLSELQCKSEDIKEETFQYMSTTLEAQEKCKELQQKIKSDSGIKNSERLKSSNLDSKGSAEKTKVLNMECKSEDTKVEPSQKMSKTVVKDKKEPKKETTCDVVPKERDKKPGKGEGKVVSRKEVSKHEDDKKAKRMKENKDPIICVCKGVKKDKVGKVIKTGQPTTKEEKEALKKANVCEEIFERGKKMRKMVNETMKQKGEAPKKDEEIRGESLKQEGKPPKKDDQVCEKIFEGIKEEASGKGKERKKDDEVCEKIFEGIKEVPEASGKAMKRKGKEHKKDDEVCEKIFEGIKEVPEPDGKEYKKGEACEKTFKRGKKILEVSGKAVEKEGKKYEVCGESLKRMKQEECKEDEAHERTRKTLEMNANESKVCVETNKRLRKTATQEEKDMEDSSGGTEKGDEYVEKEEDMVEKYKAIQDIVLSKKELDDDQINRMISKNQINNYAIRYVEDDEDTLRCKEILEKYRKIKELISEGEEYNQGIRQKKKGGEGSKDEEEEEAECFKENYIGLYEKATTDCVPEEELVKKDESTVAGSGEPGKEEEQVDCKSMKSKLKGDVPKIEKVPQKDKEDFVRSLADGDGQCEKMAEDEEAPNKKGNPATEIDTEKLVKVKDVSMKIKNIKCKCNKK